MTKRKSAIAFILVSVFLTASLVTTSRNAGELKPKERLSYGRAGEEIAYEVRFGKILLGEAKFKYLGKVDLQGKAVNLLVLETKVVNFLDKENIYSDPESMLPVRIERSISSFLKKEQIIENYDQLNYQVTITKNNGKNPPQQLVIKRNGVIHNAVLFPYSVRDLPDLAVGREFILNLPNRTLRVNLVSIESLKIGHKVFQAFRFESTPRQIAVWISTDEQRIPLKIEGSGVFGYALILKSYQGKPAQLL
jgi:hypothetical protein